MINDIANDLRSLSGWKTDDLIAAIKARLVQRFGTLPEYGIIAGQAVASACYEVVGIGAGIMRDLDWFVEQKDMEGAEHFERLRVVQGQITFFLSRCSFSDALNFNAVNKGSYVVNFSGTLDSNPDVNIIGCSTCRESEPLTASMVIEGFDLNCVEIAISLSENAIVWSQAFQNFLYSNSIQVTRCITPMHTAMRLIKKQQDLTFARLEFSEEIRVLKMARYMGVLLETHDKNYLPTQLFSQQTVDKYQNELNFVVDHYDIERVNIEFSFAEEQKEISFYKLMPVGLSHADKRLCQDTLDCFEFACADPLYAYLRSSELLLTQYRCNPSRQAMTAYEEFIRLIDAGDLNTVIDELKVNRAFARYRVRDHGIHARFIQTMKWLLRRDLHLASKLVRRDIRNIMKLATCHSALFSDYINLPITELAVIADNVRWLERRKYTFVVGLFESGSEDAQRYFSPIHSKTFKDSACLGVEQFMAASQARRFESLLDCLPLFKSQLVDKPVDVSELTTQWDFLVQGEQEQHCVGGYYLSCASYESMVLTVRHHVTGAVATALFDVNFIIQEGHKSISLHLRQFYGARNSTPNHELIGTFVPEWSEPFEHAESLEPFLNIVWWDKTADLTEEVPF